MNTSSDCRVRCRCLSTLVEVVADPKLRSIMLRRRLHFSATIFYIYSFIFRVRVTLSRYICLTSTRCGGPVFAPLIDFEFNTIFVLHTLLLRLHHLQNASECVDVCGVSVKVIHDVHVCWLQQCQCECILSTYSQSNEIVTANGNFHCALSRQVVFFLLLLLFSFVQLFLLNLFAILCSNAANAIYRWLFACCCFAIIY